MRGEKIGFWAARVPTSCRDGFTLVELLVALVMIDAGLLALVSASAAVTRSLASSEVDTRALAVASARLERALTVPCHGVETGVTESASGITEFWVERPMPNGTRELTDSVRIALSHQTKTLVLRAGGPC